MLSNISELEMSGSTIATIWLGQDPNMSDELCGSFFFLSLSLQYSLHVYLEEKSPNEIY